MSRTNLDVLFQVTALAGERTGFNIPRVAEPGPGFGDHLSQASYTTAGTSNDAGRADDRSSADDWSTNDYDSPAAEQPRNATAPPVESAPDDHDDSDYDSALAGQPCKESESTADSERVGEDGANANESHNSEETGAVDATTVDGTSAPDARQTDGEQSTEEDDLHGEEVLAVVAEVSSQGTAARAQPSKSATSESAIVKALPGSAAEVNQSSERATAEKSPAELPAADGMLDESAATKQDAIKAPTAPGEPVDETVSPNSNRKLRPAKLKAAAETEQPAQTSEQLTKQNGDVAASTDAAQAKAESTNVDRVSNESELSGRETASEESRDASSQSPGRQRTDAAALANKVVAAAVANGAATQPVSGVSSRDANDRTVKAGGSVAANGESIGDGTNRLHANAGLSKRGSRTSEADEMPRVDPARFVGRVAKAFHTAQERGGTLQIRLSPPELGAMRLELTVKDGVMTAALETESASARRVLLEHLPALRERLAEQNIRVERFDVDVRREGGGSQADPRAAQDQQQPQQGHSEQRRRQIAQPAIAEAPRQNKPVSTARTGSDGINLVA